MHVSTTSVLFLSLLGFSSAASTPVGFAPACGATLYPTILQQISEAQPFQVLPNNLNFHVAREIDSSGSAHNRRYQIVGFESIPAGSYGCQLNVKFVAGYNVTSSGNPTLSVKTLYDGDSSKIRSPNHWTWNKFYPETSPPFGSAIFGTITLVPGTTSSINDEGCPTGRGNLAYVFEIANWVPTDASAEFKQTNNDGVYLTYSC